MRALAPFLVLIPAAALATPVALTHSGFLLDVDDAPVTVEPGAFGFSVWSEATTGTRLWPASGDNTCSAAVKAGYYAVVLDGASSGCGAGLTAEALAGAPERWLQVSFAGVTLLPRTRLASAPLSTLAEQSLDTQALAATLSSTGTLNAGTNPVDWTRLKGVPATLADGTDADTTYTADGTTLALTGTQFAVKANGIGTTQLATDVAAFSKLSGGQLLLDAAGNATLAGSITATGTNHQFSGNVSVGQLLKVGSTPSDVCGATEAGMLRYKAGAFQGCDGTGTWKALASGGTAPAAGASTVLRSADGVRCLKLGIANGSYTLVQTPVDCTTLATIGLESSGGAFRLAGPSYLKSCLEYRTSPSYNSEGSGAYWIDPDGAGSNAAYKVYCDQANDGGGWTLVYDMGVFANGTASVPAGRNLVGQVPLAREDFALVGYNKVRIYSASGPAYTPVDNNDRIYGTLADDPRKVYDMLANTVQDATTTLQFGETYSDNFTSVHASGDRIYRVNADQNDTACTGTLQSSGTATVSEFCLQSGSDTTFFSLSVGSLTASACDGPFYQDMQGAKCSAANFVTWWIK